MVTKQTKSNLRTLLRWNRSPAVVNCSFEINPSELGITSYLPPSIRKIRNKEGVHGAISFIFRSPFAAEKFPSGHALSGNYVTIREALERRRKIDLIRIPDRTVFRVGQVVVHKASQCRCVVIGYDINTDDAPIQMIEIIVDEVDSNQIPKKRGTPPPALNGLQSSLLFEAVSDPQLKRISNPIVQNYFTEFDDFRGVFVPNRMLRFVYQDWEVKHEQHPSEKDKDREIKQEKDRDQTRLFQTVACTAVVRCVGTLGNQLQDIEKKSDLILNVPIRDEVTAGEAGEEAALINETMRTAISMGRKRALNDILSHVHPWIDICVSISSNTKQSLTPARDKGLLYESSVPSNNVEKYASWRSNSMEKLLRDNREGEDPEVEKKKLGGTGSEEEEEANEALSALSRIIRYVADTLSRRFQRKGFGHFELLGHLVNGPHRDGALKRYKDKEKREEEDFILPGAVYKLGQVVRHKILGHNYVVMSCEIRPINAVTESNVDINQPFYTLILEEDYAKEQWQHSELILCPQDFLEFVVSELAPPLEEKEKNMWIKFTYPSDKALDTAKESTLSPSPSPRFHDRIESRLHDAETETFKAIELTLLEMHFLVRSSLARTAAQRYYINTEEDRRLKRDAYSQSMDDLQVSDLDYLLKVARRKVFSDTLSSILHDIQVAHSNPEINAAMRLGLVGENFGSHMERFTSAHAQYVKAGNMDMRNPAPYERILRLFHRVEMNQDCVEKVGNILSHNPNHHEALTILGFSYFGMGDNEKAIKAFREGLINNPWSGSSTFLSLALMTSNKV